jgi:flagellar FliJ protein
LQRLLHLRQQHEQAMARDLMNAREAADEERRVEGTLKAALDHAERRIERNSATSFGTLQVLRTARDRLDESVLAVGERVQAAEANVDEKHQALTLAAQARRMLDRLRTRREVAHTGEMNSADQRSMDSIALTQYARADRRVNPAFPTEK